MNQLQSAVTVSLRLNASLRLYYQHIIKPIKVQQTDGQNGITRLTAYSRDKGTHISIDRKVSKPNYHV